MAAVTAVNHDCIGCYAYHYRDGMGNGFRYRYRFKTDLQIILIIMEVTNTSTQPEAKQQETKWYVLRVISGKERKVKEYLDKEIARGGWSEIVKQVFLPV